jgi:hypothetical protein
MHILHENEDNPYLNNHPNRPVVLQAGEAFERGVVKYEGDGILLDTRGMDEVVRDRIRATEPIFVSQENIFDGMLRLGIEDLEKRTLPGTELRDRFMPELEAYTEAAMEGRYDLYNKACLVYYPVFGHLAWYLNENWHLQAIEISQSSLWDDPNMEMSHDESRNKLRSVVPLIIGQSVGSEITLGLDTEFNHREIIITDKKDLGLSNIARIRGDYQTVGKSKCENVANALYGRDPFKRVYVASRGMDSNNREELVLGNHEIGLPRPDIVFAEEDTLPNKYDVAKLCQENGIDYSILTDSGFIGQMDNLLFSIYPDLSISLDKTDEEMERLRKVIEQDPSKFMDFAIAMIGDLGLKTSFIPLMGDEEISLPLQDSFRKIMLEKVRPAHGGIPQPGATVHGRVEAAINIVGYRNLGLAHLIPRRLGTNTFEGVLYKNLYANL